MNFNNTQFRKNKFGFTLLELLIALSISTIIIITLASFSGTIANAWKAGKEKVESNLTVTEALQKISSDIEGLFIPQDNSYNWLSFIQSNPASSGPGGKIDMNYPKEIFFTSRTLDKYKGLNISNKENIGGDVCAIIYKQSYQDPLHAAQLEIAEKDRLPLFALYREIIEPNEVFQDFLGKDDLYTSYKNTNKARSKNLLATNVYSLDFNFHFKYLDSKGNNRVFIYPMNGKDLKIYGDKITFDGTEHPRINSPEQLLGVDINITVLSQKGANILRRKKITSIENATLFFKQNSRSFSKFVAIPR